MTALSYVRRALQRVQERNVRRDTRIVTRNASGFVPKRVLIVGKLTRYQFEKLNDPSLNEKELKLRVEESGRNYDAMVESHRRTKAVEDAAVQILKKLGVEYKIVDRSNLDKKNFEWADLVFPIGGDGTFLLASNMIFNNQKPIVGINSYPGMSEGFLMLPPKYTTNIGEVFERLRVGNYGTVMRTRIRTTLKGDNIWNTPFHMHEKGRIAGGERFYKNNNSKPVSGSKERRLPWLALNEVFMGESLSTRTSTLLINLDHSEQTYRTKSSGFCVSTGSGSTSWFRSINLVNSQTVKDILYIADSTKVYTDEELNRISATFNQNLQRDPDEMKLSYCVRDMITMNVWPVPKGLTTRGRCNKATIVSQCYDGGLVLDGGIAVPFSYGTTAVLDTQPELALRTITLPE